MADEGETATGSFSVFSRPSVKHKLPVCIQNMFVSCGYDTPDVIAEMDVTAEIDVNQSACDWIYICAYLHCIYICINSPIRSFSCNSMHIYVTGSAKTLHVSIFYMPSCKCL